MVLTDAWPDGSTMVPPPPGEPVGAAKTDASPLSQALAFGAFAVAFAALGVRSSDPVVFVAAAAALALGIAASIGTDVRRWFRSFPGLLAAVLAMVVLTGVWVVFEARGSSFPYGVVPLAGLAVLGADWAWVERLRPLTVASGLGVVVLGDADLAGALVLALVWFGVTATALWSLQRDSRRALPTPTPIGGGRRERVDPSGQELALIAGASIALGLVLTLLISMIHLELEPPDATRPPGRSLPGGGSSSGSGSQSGSGPGSPTGRADPGSGSGSGSTSGSGADSGAIEGAQDRDGDGVIDAGDVAVLDRNGDGVIDGRDTSDPVDTNGDGVIDGDDGYVFLDLDDDGRIDGRDGQPSGRTTPSGEEIAPDRNGDGVVDRDDVPILSDTNDDGVIDRRDVVVVSDLDGNGSVDAGDVGRAADRNGDGVVDARDDIEIVDANGDGAVDDGELLDTLDRDGDGAIDRDEALVLDRDGDGRLSPDEIDDLPLSGTLGQQLEEQRRQMATEDLTRTLLISLGVLAAAAAIVIGIVALRRRLARRHERAERAWALVLTERLEAEGAARGRARRRDEPVSHYAVALGAGPLADPRLSEVGLVITAALFAPVPPDDAAGSWAAQVLDEAIAAHPLPSRAEERRERREQRHRSRSGTDEATVGAAPRH